MPTPYSDAIEYLYAHINYERTAETKPYPFRLRRMNELVDLLQLRGVCGAEVPVVHVAGTKGKGSTATMVAAMLTASGLRTGLYTSPHLLDLEERFVVDAAMATQQEVVELVQSVRQAVSGLDEHACGPATFFDLTTAMALLHFKRRGCRAIVLEVGLGGRLDSTNVCSPAVTAVTSIGLDHQHILGHSAAEIAAQKAGIIKPGIPIVSGVTDAAAAGPIDAIARRQGAPLYKLGRDFDFRLVESLDEPLAEVRDDRWTETLELISHHPLIRQRMGWQLPLVGLHQGRNAAIACVILDLLAQAAVPTSLEAQAAGLAGARCAGRIERFPQPDGLEIVLDTAHNIDSIEALCQCLERRAGGRSVSVIFGTSRDKDHRPMLQRLSRIADRIILTRYHGNPRYREPAEMLAEPLSGPSVSIQPHPEVALELAKSAGIAPQNHLIVICGSFFLAAELRPLLDRGQR
jgi:dihydrofolate synthase / folylpolyglutamate synthase